MIIVKTPLRLSFVGGGSDMRSFYAHHPGQVVCTAIDKFVYAIVKERFDDLIYINYSKKEIVDIMKAVYLGLKKYKDDFQLPCPILVAYGEHDQTGKVQAYSNRWSELENRELKVIPDAAHNANMDNPDAFNTILEDLLNALK